jgi:hypothetical protein
MTETYNWENVLNSSTLKRLKNDWINLLDNANCKERDYHDFLSSNPYFFLTSIESYLVISKLKLGSEYETDFVVVREGYSDGTIYEFIEIESPHTNLFDSTGKPTSKFNSALQQIMDWKRFLKNEKNFFRKFLPTTSTKVINDSKIKFKIIIGRRTNNKEELEKRRQYSEEYNIEILSYDRLTEILNSRRLFLNEPTIFSAQMEFLDAPLKKNQLANPFFCCTSDSTWKTICKAGHTGHFYYNFLDKILSNRTYSDYFEEFKKETAANKTLQ